MERSDLKEFRAGLERALQLLVVRCLSVARYETSNQGTELGQPTQSRHRKNWDEGVIDLFIADFECRRELETLTRTEVEAACKRLSNFFEASLDGKLAPDVTTPEYGLIRQIADRRSMLRRVNFFLTSERSLSDRFQELPDGESGGFRATYHIWDMARFHRQRPGASVMYRLRNRSSSLGNTTDSRLARGSAAAGL